MAVEPYRGSQTERFHLQRPFLRAIEDGEIDVILCTYTTFERDSGKPDRKFLSRIPFSYLVLDEAHCIKNANSTRFETLGQLQSRHRLLLSGTPVQNDVKELLNLLSFLTPKVFRRKDVRTLFLGLAIDEKNGYRGTAKELIPIRFRILWIDIVYMLPYTFNVMDQTHSHDDVALRNEENEGRCSRSAPTEKYYRKTIRFVFRLLCCGV